MREIANRNAAAVTHNFIAGELFSFLGITYPLTLVTDISPPLCFYSEFQLSKFHQQNAREVFIQWYKTKASELIPPRVDYFTNITKDKYGIIKITSAEKRWGSCSSLGNLNFSWRLIMAPQQIIDYVIVHEIAHLTEKNHGKKFWLKVEEIMPDYQERRTWLKQNAHTLVL